jgi:hypothetical protein
MRPLFTSTAAALALLLAVAPCPAQPPARPGAAELPVTRVVLFRSGVAYYQRDGQVNGTARIDLAFPVNDINDLLKSLILQDAGNGQVRAVSYDNRSPVEKTLKSFAIDLTGNPTLGQLLGQVRGERVEVALPAVNPVTGVIVGVEKQKQPLGKDQVVEVEQLNLLTADGLRGVPLSQVQRVRFLKEALEQEFRKALEVLAAGHDQQKKTVSLTFAGDGKRTVRVGYVIDSPVWKTSYRLALDKDDASLQGWAIVENTTAEDWKDVRLSLVSGRPISFLMNLYEPLFVPRPWVELELFSSIRPPMHDSSIARKDVADEAKKEEAWEEDKKKNGGGGPRRVRPPATKALPEIGLITVPDGEKGRPEAINVRRGIPSAALAGELGAAFQYEIKQPVSLARQKSALLPIVNQGVMVSRLSIYNAQVLAKHPLHGLRLKNTTGLHLTQGPVTVFDANAYAGDARLPDLQPGEERLLSYAIDLGSEVVPSTKPHKEELVSVKVYKGVIHATYKHRETTTYLVKNGSPQARRVILEHPHRDDWKLVESGKEKAERSRDLYRFEVAAPAGKPVERKVVEEQERVTEVVLASCDDDTVRFFLRAATASPALKKALALALELRAKLAATQDEIKKQERGVAVIEKDQARMRANMERVPKEAEAYKRYLKKFDEQELELEKRRAETARLEERADQQRQAFVAFLSKLNVE